MEITSNNISILIVIKVCHLLIQIHSRFHHECFRLKLRCILALVVGDNEKFAGILGDYK